MIQEDSDKNILLHNLVYVEGHVVMTVYLVWTGFSSLIGILRDHHETASSSKPPRKDRRRSSSSSPRNAILKLILFGAQIVLFIFLCPLGHLPCRLHRHAQHLVIFGAFCLSGIVDLMTLHRRHFKLPDETDTAAGILQYIVMALVFLFHGDGTSSLNSALHRPLPCLSCGIAVCHILKVCFSDSVILSLALPYTSVVTGTWLAHLAYLLFPIFPWQETLDGGSAANLHIVVLLLCFHLMAVMIAFIAVNGILVTVVFRRPLHRVIPYKPCALDENFKCLNCELISVDGGSKCNQSD